MAYTATLSAKAVDDGNANIIATVTFTNGTRTVVRKIVASDLNATLPAQVRKIVESLEAQDTALSQLTLGPITFR